MMIAAALSGQAPDAPIALTYEAAQCVLIADTEALDQGRYVTAGIPQALRQADVEVLFCGDIHSKEQFEQIAGYGITRYRAAGLTVPEAVQAMDQYRLELIRDYVGGTGCASHEGGPCSCGAEESC